MKLLHKISMLLVAFTCTNKGYAQCASPANLGSSSNMFTLTENAINPIAADKDLNTIVFVHRNNAGAFGGHSGQLRYDISTDGGMSWTNNQGVLNPLSVNGTNGARNPNIAIYNPVGNLTPSDAYLSYFGATLTGSNFSGYVSGVRKLDGTGNTETYNQPAVSQTLVPKSIVKGAPGIFWAVDEIYNGGIINGFRIFKGIWNGSNDIVWSVNFAATPVFETSYDGTPRATDYNVAFDPTGTIGWMSFLGHVSGGSTNYAYYPIFYKTIDGGNSWTGPFQVDLNQFSCAASMLSGGNVLTTTFEHDLTVDINGNPHLLTTICNGNNAYSVFFASEHHMYDITQYNGVWNAYEIATVNAGRGTFGVAPNTAKLDMQPQIARTADGEKIFFSWADNASYALGAPNVIPNLMAKAFDVVSNKWTSVKDFTSCNVALDGKMFFHHLAPEVLEPSATSFKLAAVYGLFGGANDPILTANFKFLNDIVFDESEFLINQAMANIAIDQGNSLLLCPSTPASLSIPSGSEQVLWNDGSITDSITISVAGNYIVTARVGCLIGIDTIVVTEMAISLGATNSTICAGDSTSIGVSGNAFSYIWNPIGDTNSTVVVYPMDTTNYMLTAYGSNCTYSQGISINVNPLPIVVANATNSVLCNGSSTMLFGSGADTYTWTNGVSDSVSFIPAMTDTYTVTGVDFNGCSNSATASITVVDLPDNTTSVSNVTITANETTNGATYQWIDCDIANMPIIGEVNQNFTASANGNFAVIVELNGCSDTSLCVPITTVGIQQIGDLSEKIIIYPNPNKGSFSIITGQKHKTIIVVDVIGKEIFSVVSSDAIACINLTNQPSGVYFVKVLTDSGAIVQRVVVEK